MGADALLRAGGHLQGDIKVGERHQDSAFTWVGNPPSKHKVVSIPGAGGQEKTPTEQRRISSCNHHRQPPAPCKHPKAVWPGLGAPSSLRASGLFAWGPSLDLVKYGRRFVGQEQRERAQQVHSGDRGQLRCAGDASRSCCVLLHSPRATVPLHGISARDHVQESQRLGGEKKKQTKTTKNQP